MGEIAKTLFLNFEENGLFKELKLVEVKPVKGLQSKEVDITDGNYCMFCGVLQTFRKLFL